MGLGGGRLLGRAAFRKIVREQLSEIQQFLAVWRELNLSW